jgi:hypothetical protein
MISRSLDAAVVWPGRDRRWAIRIAKEREAVGEIEIGDDPAVSCR